LEIQSRLTLIDEGFEAGKIEIHQSASIDLNGLEPRLRFSESIPGVPSRRLLEWADGRFNASYNDLSGTVAVDRRPVSGDQFWWLFFLYRDGPRAMRAWQAQGFQVSERRLVKVGDRLALTVGGDSQHEMWFDPSTLKPFGFRRGELTVRWDLSRSADADHFFPATVEFFHRQTLIGEQRVVRIVRGPSESPESAASRSGAKPTARPAQGVIPAPWGEVDRWQRRL
jgi:hypothetical protein